MIFLFLINLQLKGVSENLDGFVNLETIDIDAQFLDVTATG